MDHNPISARHVITYCREVLSNYVNQPDSPPSVKAAVLSCNLWLLMHEESVLAEPVAESLPVIRRIEQQQLALAEGLNNHIVPQRLPQSRAATVSLPDEAALLTATSPYPSPTAINAPLIQRSLRVTQPKTLAVSLPDELLIKIMHHLRPRRFVEQPDGHWARPGTPDLLRCARVCHTWSRAALQALWAFPHMTSIEMMKMFIMSTMRARTAIKDEPFSQLALKTLVIDNDFVRSDRRFKCRNWDTRPPSFLHAPLIVLANICPNLRVLNLSHVVIGASTLLQVFEACQSLNAFSICTSQIIGCISDEPPALLDKFRKRVTQLRSLEFTKCFGDPDSRIDFLQTILSSTKNLQQLVVYPNVIVDTIFNNFQYPELQILSCNRESLSLASCIPHAAAGIRILEVDEWGLAELCTLLRHCPVLEELRVWELRDCESTEELFTTLATHNPLLSKLTLLTECDEKSFTSFICSRGAGITKLDLVDLAPVTWITDKVLQCVARNCPGLKALNLKTIEVVERKFTREGFEGVVRACTKLVEVGLGRYQPDQVRNWEDELADELRERGFKDCVWQERYGVDPTRLLGIDMS
ncbi:hypothetical protein HK097_004614 [Rhizophlyctis rosea]|uniref:F-box domain-containing protein n=1 Tax=Rhizophlyctis rosea TaxID=64517 RepID=A0AAD5SJC7_9FUNG|nr:hypothetical protein HK097_004614 [Rhizophlyctis rosea]